MSGNYISQNPKGLESKRNIRKLNIELIKENKKICTNCKETKTTKEFQRYAASKDGLRYTCLICTRKINVNRYQSSNKEEWRAKWITPWRKKINIKKEFIERN